MTLEEKVNELDVKLRDALDIMRFFAVISNSITAAEIDYIVEEINKLQQ